MITKVFTDISTGPLYPHLDASVTSGAPRRSHQREMVPRHQLAAERAQDDDISVCLRAWPDPVAVI